MLRITLSIVAGLLVAFLLVFAGDALFHALVPSSRMLPADTSDRLAMAAYVESQPTGALVGLALGWAVAALIGTAIAARFAVRGEWPGWVVGGVFLLATASNFVLVPHPGWMVAFAVITIVAGSWAGACGGARSTARTA